MLTEEIILDPLYGKWALDEFLSQLMRTPEVQRLREVRFSNINSLLMPGCSNVSRFEHSLGVAFLAREVCKNLQDLDSEQRRSLGAAAILHDIGTPPFGHTVEFVLRKHFGFDHEIKSCDIIKRQHSRTRQDDLQFPSSGMQPYAWMILDKYRLDKDQVTSIIRGHSKLGKLINGRIDLDNIDGVPRMIYHMGLRLGVKFDPIRIARGFRLRKRRIHFDQAVLEDVERLRKARRLLYKQLLLDRWDCSAKAMLSRATDIAIKAEKLDETVWALTDGEFLSRLLSLPETREIARQLAVGDLYNALGGFLLEEEQASRVKATLEKEGEDIENDLVGLLREKGLCGKRAPLEVVIDMVPASTERGMDNLPFLPMQLTVEEKFEEKTIGITKTSWLLGVYISRKEIENRYYKECADFLASQFGNAVTRKLAWKLGQMHTRQKMAEITT